MVTMSAVRRTPITTNDNFSFPFKSFAEEFRQRFLKRFRQRLDDMMNQENATHTTQINSDIIRDPIRPQQARPNNGGISRGVKKKSATKRGATKIPNTNNADPNIGGVNGDDGSGPNVAAVVRKCSLCKTHEEKLSDKTNQYQ